MHQNHEGVGSQRINAAQCAYGADEFPGWRNDQPVSQGIAEGAFPGDENPLWSTYNPLCPCLVCGKKCTETIKKKEFE